MDRLRAARATRYERRRARRAPRAATAESAACSLGRGRLRAGAGLRPARRSRRRVWLVLHSRPGAALASDILGSGQLATRRRTAIAALVLSSFAPTVGGLGE